MMKSSHSISLIIRSLNDNTNNLSDSLDCSETGSVFSLPCECFPEFVNTTDRMLTCTWKVLRKDSSQRRQAHIITHLLEEEQLFNYHVCATVISPSPCPVLRGGWTCVWPQHMELWLTDIHSEAHNLNSICGPKMAFDIKQFILYYFLIISNKYFITHVHN